MRKTNTIPTVTVREAARMKRTSATTISTLAAQGVLTTTTAKDTSGRERVTGIVLDDHFAHLEVLNRPWPKRA